MSKVIRAKCLDCSAGSTFEVKNCIIPECPLFPYRMGRNPKPDDLRVAQFDNLGNLLGYEDWPSGGGENGTDRTDQA